MKGLLVALVVFTITGCGSRLVVSSNTYWAGTVDGHPVAGSGTATFRKEKAECVIFEKLTREGYLELHIEREGFLRPDGERERTTEEYGRVRLCGK